MRKRVWQERALRNSFALFIGMNIVLEVINMMYTNKIVINKDKYMCIVKDKEKNPAFTAN